MNLYGLNLLDKLFDDGGPDRGAVSIDRLKDSVARDVEALLNTRCGLPESSLASFPHSRRSVLSFGVKDFVSMCLGSQGDRERLCEDIRRALHVHEPRLRDPVVSVSVTTVGLQKLHFAIQALLVAPDINEVVSFDAVLQPVSQRYQVSRGH
ncbi:type VI secretion system baseplate subunit TssE [Aquabacterium sp.]|uniref:type VI secretion system baseplate subunit TssE n=1 Tax=Aquabacterium sp. TaxID=1872578 RepID=UPI0035AE53E7